MKQPVAIALAVIGVGILMLSLGVLYEPEDTAKRIAASRQHIQEQLPSGCELHELGKFVTQDGYTFRTIVVVICEGQQATTLMVK